MVAHDIFRKCKIFQRVFKMVIPCTATVTCTIGRDYEITLGVIAASTAHCINEALGVAVYGVICRACYAGIILSGGSERGEAPRTLNIEHLIIAFENKTVVVILKLLGYLTPNSFKAGALLGIDSFVGNEPCRICCTCVMMDIKYAIHVLRDDIVNYLTHTRHPCRLYPRAYIILRRIPDAILISVETEFCLHVRIPCNRHTDSIDACVLKHLQKFGLSNWLSPGCLVILWHALCPVFYPHIERITRITVEGIAEVPAYAHIRYCLVGCLEILCHCRHCNK